MIKFIQVVTILIITNRIWCDDDCLPDKDILKCCEVPLLVDLEMHEVCAKEINYQKGAKYDAAIECKMSECVMKKANAIVDGKPSASEIKKFVKKMLDENPGWENVFNAAVDKCIPHVTAQEAETRKRASAPPFNMDATINPIFAHLLECIGTELILECPEKSRGTDAKCDAIKADLKRCAKNFPPLYLATA